MKTEPKRRLRNQHYRTGRAGQRESQDIFAGIRRTWDNDCMTGFRTAIPARSLRAWFAALAPLALVAVVGAGCDLGSKSTFPVLPTAEASPTAGASPSTAASPSSGPTGSEQAIYAAIEAQVQQLRGLEPKTPISPTLLDEQGIRDWMTHAFETEIDHEAMAATSRLLEHLGLLPPGSSLEQLELDLESGQVVGFYDTASKQLYLLSKSGGVGAMQKWTFSHEYTHALQDQTFGLDKLETDAPDQDDRDIARTALVEGDAMLVTNAWTQQYMSLLDQLSLLGEASNDTASAQLAAAPAILRVNLMFPYEEGADFVAGIYKQGGWAAVNAMYDRPPNSTSQILHPELYAGRVEPVALSLPAVPASLGSGWKLSMQDTIGELQLRVWLEGEAPSSAESGAAADAVSKWGGDRVGLYEGPSGAWAVVLRTNWRTASGRVAFQDAASARIGKLSSPAIVCASGNDVAVYVASSTTALEAFAPCRPPL
jgi:hypothetical protein